MKDFCKAALVLMLMLQALPGAAASVTDDVHRLVLAEKFDEAKARASAAISATIGDDRATELKHLVALNALLDEEQARFTLHSDSKNSALLDEAIALTGTLYGSDSRRLARLLMDKATVEIANRRNVPNPDSAAKVESETLANRAMWLSEHGTGRIDDLDLALVYTGMSDLTTTDGKYAESVELLQKGEKLLEKSRTKWQTRRLARLLLTLGNLQERLGQMSEALSNLHQALTLAAQVSGKRSSLYSEALLFLGQVQNFDADYLGAKSSLSSALEFSRSHPTAPIHVYLATNLVSLANTLRHLGDYDNARVLYEETIAFTENSKDLNENSKLAGRLDDLALLEEEVGNLDRARRLLEKALALREAAMGADHIALTAILVNLGEVTLGLGDVATAGKYYRRAVDISAANPSASGVSGLSARIGLSHFDLASAQPKEADELLTRSLAEAIEFYGEQHPGTVPIRCDLATAKARLGDLKSAYALAHESEVRRIDILRRVVPALGESQALNLKRFMGSCDDVILAIAAKSQDPAVALDVWQIVADSRGLATRLRASRLEAARNTPDPALRLRWETWELAARAYADVLLKSGASPTATAAARARLDRAEVDLGAQHLSLAGATTSRQLRELTDSLPGDTALVAYERTGSVDFDAQSRQYEPAGFALFALVSDHRSPRVVALGDDKKISALVDDWYRLLRDPKSDSADLQTKGTLVRESVWDPLDIKIATPHVFVVPDSALFRVNFAALPQDEGFMVERGWRAHLLDNESDFQSAGEKQTPRNFLVLGNPDFGASNAELKAGNRDACSYFSPLPGTQTEVTQLSELWRTVMGTPATTLTGPNASKHALLAAAQSSGIIHIATHAAEVGAACESSSARGMTLSIAPGVPVQTSSKAALALAGANNYLSRHDAAGILTDEEVVTMSLDHTEIVILAACDTGLGELIDGEGIFGLRRAFRLAGAHAVVMSLWKVDDSATASWMEAFYEARLKDKQALPSAIAQAQLATLAARRALGESTHPYYWAAFVGSGDWR